ncbi:MAG: hypothetical protein ACKPFA_31555, partial [Dolichospermum sp.]
MKIPCRHFMKYLTLLILPKGLFIDVLNSYKLTLLYKLISNFDTKKQKNIVIYLKIDFYDTIMMIFMTITYTADSFVMKYIIA